MQLPACRPFGMRLTHLWHWSKFTIQQELWHKKFLFYQPIPETHHVYVLEKKYEKSEIGDSASIEFSVAFYDALGAGESVQFAYKLACNAIQWYGFQYSLVPVLIAGEKNTKEKPEKDKSFFKHSTAILKDNRDKLKSEQFYCNHVIDEYRYLYTEGINYNRIELPDIFTAPKFLKIHSEDVYDETVPDAAMINEEYLHKQGFPDSLIKA